MSFMTASPPSAPGRKTILLVEDNADDEALTMRALSRNGLGDRVQVAHDGVEALEFLFCQGAFAGRDTEQMPAVTLLDLKLPRVDGLEVLRQVRGDERTRRLPVVILTSSREENDLARGYGLGANSYIRKPVDFAEFMDVVKRVGDYWLCLNEEPPPQA